MDKETYLVLRITGDAPVAFDPLAPQEKGPGVLQDSEPVEYQIKTEALDAGDYRELRRDRKVAAIAKPMPLRLIQPVAVAAPHEEASAEPAQVNGATWGVYVTGALQSPYVGHGVTVAVLDTGIEAGHEAFGGVELVQRDWTGEGNGDWHGHGTHVAGTIFGQTVGNVRFGVAPGVRRALIGKVIGEQNAASTKELIEAIQWAVDGGAQVINMSLGFDFPGLVQWWSEQGMEVDLATSRALAQYRDNVRFFDRLVGLLQARAAQESSALLIAAAGNESRRERRADYAIEVSPPAAADGVLSVAALRSVGAPHNLLKVAPFSNIRAAIAAPGVSVYSATKGGGYTLLSGTSMASPHVAGIAALWAERQIDRNGVVNISALDAQLRGNARSERLPDADYLDVGEGLVSAPLN